VPDKKVVKRTCLVSANGQATPQFNGQVRRHILNTKKKPVVLHSSMGIGDACLFTIVLESLATQYKDRFSLDVVGKYADQIFKNNPHLEKDFDHQFAHHVYFEHCETVSARRGMMDTGSLTHQQACCDYVGEQLGIRLISQFNRPIFYLTEEDKKKRLFTNPYCFINAGWKSDIEVKWYSRWQEVVDRLHEIYPQLLIVQIGAKTDSPAFNVQNHPLLNNVIDMRGRWDGNAWDFICAAYHAEFGLGPTSFIKHVFSGLEKPYVCVIPGDEPLTWTYSPGVDYVHKQGKLSCCRFGACYKHTWRNCTNMVGHQLPRCMDIPVQRIIDGVKEYVDGGLITRKMDGPATSKTAVSCASDITIGTIYDEGMKELGDWTAATMRDYAARHNYNLLVAHRPDPSRPPSWSKILLITNVFKHNPACKWFWWIDADCKIRNLDIRLETIIDENYDLIIGEDRPGDVDAGLAVVNAGVFLIRNCPTSLEFLTGVWNHPRTPPYYEGNWEQQALREMAFTTPGFRTKIIPRRTFNSFADEWEPGDFVQHGARGTGGRQLFEAEMKGAAPFPKDTKKLTNGSVSLPVALE
jgi:hypothetical protein